MRNETDDELKTKGYLDKHIKRVNKTLCHLFLVGAFFPLLVFVLSVVHLYNYPLKLALITSVYSFCGAGLCFLFEKIVPSKIFKYILVSLLEIVVILLSLDVNLTITVTYLLAPLFTIMYFSPRFTLFACGECLIFMLISCWITAPQSIEMFWPGISRMYRFLTAGSGLFLEMSMITILLYYASKRANEYMFSVFKRNELLSKMQTQMVYSFADIIESKEATTGLHVKRTSLVVSVLTRYIRRKRLYKGELESEDYEIINIAAPLHDIGKIAVSNEILCKPAKLTPEEFEEVKKHTVEGGQLIVSTLSKLEAPRFLEIACNMASYHHEKWDGSGYPFGLAGENIPLCARIMAVADVFDALCSPRPYKDAFTIDESYEIIIKSKETHFDPLLVDAMIALRPEIEKIYSTTFI